MTKGPVLPGRLLAFDAARGIAMFGVVIAHFGLVIERVQPGVAERLQLIGMYAAPTFVLVSGAMLGYLLAGKGVDVSRLQVRLADRALFILIVGHVLIELTLYHRGLHRPGQLVQLFMTDTIACSLLAGVYLVPRVARRLRLAFAAGLYSLSWFAVIFWTPYQPAGRLLKECLVGTIEHTDAQGNAVFSVLPWAAVYLAATVLGEVLPGLIASRRRQAGLAFVSGGGLAVGAALVAKAAYLALRPVAWASPADMPQSWYVFYKLTTPFGKYPPGPVYLLFYGGLGLALIGCCMLAVEFKVMRSVTAGAAVVGRASLMVFILQYYVLYLGVVHLPLTRTGLLPIFFLASLASLWAAAWAWNRWAGNHLLTVGLRGPATPFVSQPAAVRAK